MATGADCSSDDPTSGTSDEEGVEEIEVNSVPKDQAEVFFARISHEEASTFASELLKARGETILFSGIGRSGVVARKIAGALASVGFPRATFLSPIDALEGGLRAVGHNDRVVVVSKSGSSNGVVRLLPLLQRKGVRILSLTSTKGNALANSSHHNVHLPLEEIDGSGTDPVTSPSIQMLFMDTLALALSRANGMLCPDCTSKYGSDNIAGALLHRMRSAALAASAPPSSTSATTRAPETSRRSTSRGKLRCREENRIRKKH